MTHRTARDVRRASCNQYEFRALGRRFQGDLNQITRQLQTYARDEHTTVPAVCGEILRSKGAGDNIVATPLAMLQALVDIQEATVREAPSTLPVHPGSPGKGVQR